MRLTLAIHPTALLVCLALLTSGCSSSKNEGGNGPKPYVAEGSISTVEATVEAIDYNTRRVTLKGESGNSVTFTAGDKVKNLEQVKVGDRVKAAYAEAVEIKVRDPKAEGREASASATTSDWEQAQDRAFGRDTTLTAVVDRVDRKKGIVLLRGPAGNVYPFQVRDRKNLENVKVGDEVVASYREGLAVAIEPASP